MKWAIRKNKIKSRVIHTSLYTTYTTYTTFGRRLCLFLTAVTRSLVFLHNEIQIIKILTRQDIIFGKTHTNFFFNGVTIKTRVPPPLDQVVHIFSSIFSFEEKDFLLSESCEK